MQLHIKAKVISIHAKMDILDEEENLVYQVESKAVSIHNKTYIKNADGEEVAYISRKAISIHGIHYVEMANGTKFELSEELFHLTKDIINIDELGWQLKGDFTGHNYDIIDSNESIVASTHRKWLSMHSIYYIDILDERQMDIVVAIIIALAHMITDKEAAAMSTGAGTDTALNNNSTEN